MFSICVLLTTLHRPVGLARVLGSLQISAPTLPVVCAIDDDDEQAKAICQSFGAAVAVCPEKRQGPSKAWNTALAAVPDYDAYILAADDLIFSPGWLEATLEALDKIGGSGMVGFNDHLTQQPTHYLLTRDFIIQHNGGVMCCPHYRTWGPDTETWERAKAAGKYIWAKHAVVMHDWQGNSPTADQTYRDALPHRAESKALYYQRKKQGFPNDFAPILREAANELR